jgi:hypothetical protein
MACGALLRVAEQRRQVMGQVQMMLRNARRDAGIVTATALPSARIARIIPAGLRALPHRC